MSCICRLECSLWNAVFDLTVLLIMILLNAYTFMYTLLLYCSYCGYAKDRSLESVGFQEEFIMSILCLVQCILLGSFAAILGAHRSDIMEKSTDGDSTEGESAYEPPRVSK